jgi:ribosomal protein L37E
MDIGTILVGVALLVLVVAYVTRPLFERQSGRSNGRATSANPRAQLTAHRDAIYALIRELDADYQTGKINDEDYQTQRKLYVAEGVSLLKSLDALADEDGRAALEAEIEAAVLALRQKPSTIRFCTQCGHQADPADNFCSRCGAPLSLRRAQPSRRTAQQ